MTAREHATPAEFQSLPDLAGRLLGGAVVWANDDFFGSAHNLISAAPAGHDATGFDARGKVYDGWETRHRRSPGVDARAAGGGGHRR